MSLLSEVAGRADVPVEGVVRVVTRQPVSRRIEQRVLTVLDALEPEQLRSLERLALAAAPNVLPVGAAPPSVRPNGVPDERHVEQPSEPPVDPQVPPPTRSLDHFAGNGAGALSEADRLTVQLGSLLEDIVHSLNEMRRDVLADRRDRVDDLAVLVDLLTTSWSGVDRRLGRIERSLARLDAAREPPPPPVPLQVSPALVEPEPPAPAPTVEPLPREEETRPSRTHRVLTMFGTPLLFIGALAAALLTFELLASSSDDPRLGPPPDVQQPPTTSLSSTTGGAPTVTGSTQPTAPTAPTTTGTTPATTGTTPTTTGTTPTTTGTGSTFTPARVFAWPPVDGAAYYRVRFFRGSNLIYQAWPSKPRLTLPKTVVFAPGSYRWVVRPGVGPRAQNRVGASIIDSSFEIES